MKFGQLIEYNMRNIFLEKSYRKCRVPTLSKIPKKIRENRKILGFSFIHFLNSKICGKANKVKYVFVLNTFW